MTYLMQKLFYFELHIIMNQHRKIKKPNQIKNPTFMKFIKFLLIAALFAQTVKCQEIDCISHRSKRMLIYKEYTCNKQFLYEAHNINNIFIQSKAGELKVGTTPEDNIKISAEIVVTATRQKKAEDFINKDLLFDLTEENNSFECKYHFGKSEGRHLPMKHLIKFLSVPAYKVNLTVYVPENKNLKIKDYSGNISLSDIHGNVDISDESGDITIQNLHGSLILNDGSGNIFLSNIVASDNDSYNKIKITDGSGNITGRKITGNTILSDGSGDININNYTGNMNINDNAGNIHISDVTGTVAVDSDGSGNKFISYNEMK